MKRSEDFYGVKLAHQLNTTLEALVEKDILAVINNLKSLALLVEDEQDAVMIGTVVCCFLKKMNTNESHLLYAAVRHSFRSGDARSFFRTLAYYIPS